MTAAEESATRERVCAVVVTYNRKALLEECVAALHAQTHPLEKILIVDNASSDGTAELWSDPQRLQTLRVTYRRLEKNVGGAGGFHEGFKEAYRAGAEWIWALDDDTILEPDALERLLAARAKFSESVRPDVLSSLVLWTDGAPHPMNRAWPKKTDPNFAVEAERHGTTSIRAATFVATLFHSRYIREFGLPIADYFIWADDIEYTGRILREQRGVLVPDSIAVHKTAAKYTANDSKPERFYFHVRNTVWMLTRSSAWSWRERRGMLLGFVLTIASFLKRSHLRLGAIAAVFRAFWHGFFTAPRPAEMPWK